MNCIRFLLFLILFSAHTLFALPSLSISWKDNEKTKFKLNSTATSVNNVSECIEEGYSFENRFEVKACKKGIMWFETCTEEKVFVSQVVKDPVTLQFALKSDILGDGEDPDEIVLPTIAEAHSRLMMISQVSLSDFKNLKIEDSRYLSARVTESCKGSVSPTLRRVSQLLTLGLLDIRGVDSGWIVFPLS